MRLGLLGKDIGHSQSQRMYEDLLQKKIDYTLFDYPCPEQIPPLDIFFQTIEGLNITTPYKKHFYDAVKLDLPSPRIMAINCIGKKQGAFVATNTDYLALEEILPPLLEKRNIILLGNGSMAQLTEILFSKLGVPYEKKTRQEHGDLSTLSFDKDDLVINACARAFVYAGDIHPQTLFYDYNYSFTPHEYLKSSCQYIDGLELLYSQAKHALRFLCSG